VFDDDNTERPHAWHVGIAPALGEEKFETVSGTSRRLQQALTPTTRTEPLHEGAQVDSVSPMASGSLESCSARNSLILQVNITHHAHFWRMPLN